MAITPGVYTSPFETGIQFLDRLGVYEVLLPFLLIFTIVYAILEKSRVFGIEKVGDVDMPKKNRPWPPGR